MVFIYVLLDPNTLEIRYVGKTKNCYQRFRHHLVNSANKKSHKRSWINSLREQGLKPIMQIIDEVEESEWQFWEQHWIVQLKCWGFNLVNHTAGGDGLTKGNQTSFRKGFIPWNKGYSGYSTSAKGKVIPNDIKQRISQTLKGNQNRTLIPIIQYDLNMNLINQFPSVKEAVKVTGIKQSAISNCLTGRSKTAGKFIWQYMV